MGTEVVAEEQVAALPLTPRLADVNVRALRSPTRVAEESVLRVVIWPLSGPGRSGVLAWTGKVSCSDRSAGTRRNHMEVIPIR